MGYFVAFLIFTAVTLSSISQMVGIIPGSTLQRGYREVQWLNSMNIFKKNLIWCELKEFVIFFPKNLNKIPILVKPRPKSYIYCSECLITRARQWYVREKIDITFHVLASQLSRRKMHLWRHKQNVNKASETRNPCVWIVLYRQL